jgi:kynurenine formamidase
MAKWVFLSHTLGAGTPAYGGGEGFVVKEEKSISRGDSCNTSVWSFPSHLGTHIDFPYHFFGSGRKAEDYPPEFWHFARTAVADCPVGEGELIRAKDIMPFVSGVDDALLIKTGFEKFRKKKEYWKNGPGIAPDVALWLRKGTSVRVLGFDFISVSRWADRDTGREAHRAFLGPGHPGRPVLLIEDMSLAKVEPGYSISEMFVLPLRVEGSDGSPCTVLAKVV